MHELVEVGGDRQLLAECERSAPPPQRAGKLEREERVAAGGLPDPDQGRAREGRIEAGAQQPQKRADAQPGDLHCPQLLLRHSAAQPGGHLAACGDQGGDRFIQAGKRVAERGKRRGVQPLDIVYRHAQRPVARKQSQRTEERGGDDALVGLVVRVAAEKRSSECALLDGRQLRDDLVGVGAQKVGQPCERIAGLGLRRPAGKHPVTPLDRRFDSRRPQRRLADPGLTGEHDDAGKLLGVVEELDDRRELVLPADEVPGGDVHAAQYPAPPWRTSSSCPTSARA